MQIEIKSKKVITGLNRTIEGSWSSMHFDAWTWGNSSCQDWEIEKITGLIDEEDQLFYILPDKRKIPTLGIMLQSLHCFGRDKLDGTPHYFCELSQPGIVVDSFIKNGKLDGLALDGNSRIIRNNADVGDILQRNENLWEKYR